MEAGPDYITDWQALGAGAVGRIPDARVVQFRDPPHALSQAIRRGRVEWAAKFSGAPVVRAIDDFRLRLITDRDGSSSSGS